MSYKYTCLNPIAEVGLGNLDDNYTRTEDFAAADAVFVRSAKMDEMTPGPNHPWRKYVLKAKKD